MWYPAPTAPTTPTTPTTPTPTTPTPTPPTPNFFPSTKPVVLVAGTLSTALQTN